MISGRVGVLLLIVTNMHLPAYCEKDARRAFVLTLVATFLCFAIWLKVSPNLSANSISSSSPIVKLWLDPTPGWEAQVKLAPLGTILLLIVLVPAVLVATSRPVLMVPVPRLAAKDVFSESRHWFRPPPLF